jgi:hypothetical protein
MSVYDIWREHVLHAINWNGLKAESTWDKWVSMGIALDLFFGGNIHHEIGHDSIVCRGCAFGAHQEVTPACQCHLGVVAAFFEAFTGMCHRVRKTSIDCSCVIEI